MPSRVTKDTLALGDRIREARKRCGKTQTQVAEELGLYKQTISQWERGKTPELQNLVRYAKVVGVEVSELLTGLSHVVSSDDDTSRRLSSTSKLLPLYKAVMAGEVMLKRIEVKPDRYIASMDEHPKTAVAVVVSNRAMESKLKVDDVVTIDPTLDPEPGNIVFARVGDDYVLRRFIPQSNKGVKLVADNPRFPELELKNRDKILGVMREHITTSHD